MGDNAVPNIPGVNTSDVTGGGGDGNLLQNIIGMLTKVGSRNPTSPNTGSVITNQTTMPGANVPMPQKKYPDMYPTRDTRNRNVQFGDMMHNLGSMVQTAEQNHEAREARKLSVDIERIMIASQNPNDPQNAQIINDIMSDPKKRKAIKEALDISFMGEDKRGNVTREALDMAMKKINGKGLDSNSPLSDQSQVLLSKLPKAAGISPELQALAQLIKDGVVPKAGDTLKADTAIQGKAMDNATKASIAQELSQQKDRASVRQSLTKIGEIYGKKVAAEILDKSRRYSADRRFQAEKYKADKALEIANARISAGQYDKDNKIKDTINELKASISADQLKLKGIIANKAGFDKDGYSKALQELEKHQAALNALIGATNVNNNGSSNTGTGPVIGTTGDDLEKEILGTTDTSDDDDIFNQYNSIVGQESDDQ